MVEKGEKETADKALKDFLKNEDFSNIFTNYYLFPLYDCSYKNRINVTYFKASGAELKTDNQFPTATGVERGERKFSVSPGDMVNVIFTIPDDAVKWDVWVSK